MAERATDPVDRTQNAATKARKIATEMLPVQIPSDIGTQTSATVAGISPSPIQRNDHQPMARVPRTQAQRRASSGSAVSGAMNGNTNGGYRNGGRACGSVNPSAT